MNSFEKSWQRGALEGGSERLGEEAWSWPGKEREFGLHKGRTKIQGRYPDQFPGEFQDWHHVPCS